MQKYELNLSAVKGWEQLKQELVRAFSFDVQDLKGLDDLWDLFCDLLTRETELTVYGLGKMAEDMPKEASRLRGIFQGIDELHGLLDVYYEQSSL